MKAAIFYSGKDIRLEETPLSAPGPGEVLFKVLSAGSGSDLHLYRGQNPYAAGFVEGSPGIPSTAVLGQGCRELLLAQVDTIQH